MSQGHAHVAIEWSPSQVVAYDGQSKQYFSGPTLADVASSLHANVPAVVTISRRSSFIKAMRVPDLPSDEARQIVRMQLDGLFPVPGHELAFDLALTDDINAEGRLAVVVAVRAQTLAHVQDELKRVGIRPTKLFPISLGSPLFARHFEESDCAVVEHTSEGIGIDIVSGGVLAYSRVAPLPKSSDELDAEVCRTFSIAKVACAKVIAAGGLTFDGADRTVAQRTLEVILAGQDKIQLSLELPEVIAERQRKKLAAKMRVAILLWVVAIAAAGFVYMDRYDLAAKARSADSKAQTTLRKVRSTKSTVEAQLLTTKAIDLGLTQAFKPAQRFSDVMTVISNIAPQGVWLTGMNLERGRDLQIRGTALTNGHVASFIDSLNAQSRFRDVKLAFANNAVIGDTPVVNFSITTHAVGNLPVVEDTKGAKKR